MFVDLNEVDSDPFKDKTYDVCICGAGVAGITLALKLSPQLNVALLEAGGFEYSQESQAVYKGRSVGKPYFDLATTRLRYFGGTSNHWTGLCRPLDSYDFQPKSYVEFSGWPIARGDLDPYLEEAKSILDIPAAPGGERNIAQEALWSGIESSKHLKRVEFWNSGTRFGTKYRHAIEAAPNITCYLNANVIDILLDKDLSRVGSVTACNYRGKSFAVRAQTLVIATGGLENPRLLLNCNSQMADGLGNGNGLVGRFFAEHPHHKAGTFILEDRVKAALLSDWPAHGAQWAFFAPTEEFMNQDKILNFGIRVNLYSSIRDGNAGHAGSWDFRKKLRQLICESGYLKEAYKKLRGRELSCLNAPDDSDMTGDGFLIIAFEQAPNPASRVSLGSDLDEFGQRRILLDWRLSGIDGNTIQRALLQFAKTFAAQDIGRVRLRDWLVRDAIEFPRTPENFPGWAWDIGGNHHMCTTRMGGSPRDGVVDRNLRVFGIDNLYLAGSSVFSTAGHANPTFTIVQTTLRLAGHLNDRHRLPL